MENNISVAEISDVADKTGNGFSDKKHEKTKTDWNKIGFLFSMFIIPCLNFLIFYVYVNFDSVLLSFQKRDGSFTLENFAWVFKELASEDSVLKEAFINAITFFLNEYIVVRIVTLIMAYFFYKKIMGYGFFRVLFYVPNILSAVVMVSIYDGFIGPSGPLYQFLEQQTGVQYEFLFDSRYAMKALLIYQIWLAFGTGTIMLTSAMGRIPEEVTEAAYIDGDFIIAVNSKRKHKRIEYKKIPIIKALKPYIKDGLPKTPRAENFRKAYKSVLPNHILYDMRTTFYSRCKEYGVSEHALSEYMGHSLGAIGNAYTDLSDEYLLNESKKLDFWE